MSSLPLRTSAAHLIAEAMDAAPAPILFAGEDFEAPQGVTLWSRHIAPWPPEGSFNAGVLRLPLDKSAYRMALHAIAARLPKGAPLFVYGFNDEGIKSANKAFAPFFDNAETVTAKGHARVWCTTRSAVTEGLRATLADWRDVQPLALPTGPRDWVSYPGVFAKGGLDTGTALLLGQLPDVGGKTVLDFAAGTGVIARVLADLGAHVTLVERDTVALQAARENVPEAAAVPGSALPGDRFDLIVSNPPIHQGKARDLQVVTALIANAPRHLRPRGLLLLVAQKTVPVPRLAGSAFAKTELAAEEGGFRVWRLTKG